MEHTPECKTSMERQQQEFNDMCERDFARMKAAGIDTSMRGIGYSIRCICKTQETQQC